MPEKSSVNVVDTPIPTIWKNHDLYLLWARNAKSLGNYMVILFVLEAAANEFRNMLVVDAFLCPFTFVL